MIAAVPDPNATPGSPRCLRVDIQQSHMQKRKDPIQQNAAGTAKVKGDELERAREVHEENVSR